MKMLALLGSIRPLAIILAPSVGGILGAKFGWRNVFLVLCGWGVLNIVATQLLLVETLTKREESKSPRHGYWTDTRAVLTHRNSISLIVIMALVFSAPTSMLSNIAFLLQGFGLTATTTSLLIGSIPCMMILAGGIVFLCGRSPKCIMIFGMLALFVAGVTAVVIGSDSAYWQHWACFMSPLYLMVFAQSLFIPPAMALYLQPHGDRAGFASGVMSFSKTVFPTCLAFLSTTVTDMHGASGFLFFIAFVLFLSNTVFCIMPPFHEESQGDGDVIVEEEDEKETFVVEMDKNMPSVSDGAWLLNEDTCDNTAQFDIE